MKKVLIVSRRYTRKNKLINWVSEIYLEILAKAGVVPIIVPIAEGMHQILAEYLNDYDGLLMMEGGDIDPKYYNETYPTVELDEYDPLKDKIEIACLKHAMAAQKPILGFCRGVQLINVMHGGTVYKDVHEANGHSVVHINYDNYDGHRHHIKIMEDTPLFDWYQEKELMVNSYHHQGIKILAPDLLPMAVADDGLIEGVYHPHRKFLVGLQFHPERMYDEHPGNKKVFEAYCKAL